MQTTIPNILRFHDHYMERIWGGDRMRRLLQKPIAPDGSVGEAWLISDHPSCESVVSDGSLAGRSLSELITNFPDPILGTLARPTSSGRFPLLLKLIDAEEVLSVQVHPDDRQAARLGESDSGKTEMWHVLHAAPEARLVLGFSCPCDRASLRDAARNGSLEKFLNGFPVREGDSVFVGAGTVHAIGAGILLAEIQQNSDITYRLYDWNRRDAQGNPRALHLEKALEVLNYAPAFASPKCPGLLTAAGISREILAVCPYFAAERITVSHDANLPISGASFHILLALSHELALRSGNHACVLRRGEAALLPARAGQYFIAAPASFLRYYVPDLERDIMEPLRRHGLAENDIRAFCGHA